jgi:hypothetical protein
MDRGIVSDLETLILLKQIAEMPPSNVAAATTMTRMLRIAHEGNMNRQIARDALAKLKAPASPAPATPAVAKLTTTRTVAPEGTYTGDQMTADPEKEFSVILPIDLLALVEMKGGTDWIIGLIKANSEA